MKQEEAVKILDELTRHYSMLNKKGRDYCSWVSGFVDGYKASEEFYDPKNIMNLNELINKELTK